LDNTWTNHTWKVSIEQCATPQSKAKCNRRNQAKMAETAAVAAVESEVQKVT